MADLGLQGILIRLPEQPVWPSWFIAGKNTPRTHKKQVARGRHPLGQELGGEATKCGTCEHCWIDPWHSKRYYKCAKVTMTSGPATDVRLKWRGCVLWEERTGTDP